MVPVLFDFTWADAPRDVDGVTLGGRAHVLKDPVSRHALWRVVDDAGRRLRASPGHRDVGPLERARLDDARRGGRHRDACRRDACGSASASSLLHVRWHTTHPITVGLASALGLPLCRDLGLDVLQVHWYDHLERRAPLARRPHVPWSDAPLVLGEFPTRGSARLPSHIVAAAREAGYAAAWPWSLRADDTSTDTEATLHALHDAHTDASSS